MNASMKARVEPWRQYFPYRPDDFPPKGGDKKALLRVLRDPDIEKEDAFALLKGVTQ